MVFGSTAVTATVEDEGRTPDGDDADARGGARGRGADGAEPGREHVALFQEFTFLAPPSPSTTDTDADGLPDAWESLSG